jgi:CBS domain containing-hemolysin-like protein
LVVLLLGNAFFVAAEFGIVSAKRSQIEPFAEDGKKSARTALWAMEHVSVMLAICQLGITVCSLLLGNVAEPAIHHLLAGPLEFLGVPTSLSDVIAFVVALAIVTYLHVVVGEMIPKNIAIAAAASAAMLLAPPLVFLSKVFGFVIHPLNGFANLVLRLVGVEPKGEVNAAFTVEEVQAIVAESQEEGLLRDDTGILQGALEFSDKSVADTMVPLADLVTIDARTTPAALEALVARTGFSRYVLTDGAGAPVAYLHIKDVLYADNETDYHAPVQPRRFREMTSVPGEAEIEDGLEQMRADSSHVARVVGTQGAVVGVVFLEDILEELVGEVDDAMQRRA